MSAINVGLIGFGLGGSVFHAPLIHHTSNLILKHISTSNLQAAQQIKVRYPAVTVSATATALLQDNTLNLVVISVPNQHHYTLAKQALQSGKHVVVDKPFTVTVQQAQQLIKLANSKGLMLSVFHNRRWDGDFLTVKHLLACKQLGEVVEAEMHFDKFRPNIKPGWKEEDAPGTGILFDLGAHLIDQALQIFGTPTSLLADIRMQRQDAIAPDYFEVQLFYSQLKVILKASNLAASPTPRFLLHGTKGSFVKYGLDVQEAHLRAGKTPQNFAPWGEEPTEQYGTLYSANTSPERVKTKPGNYGAFYQNIAQHLLSKVPLCVTPQQGLQVVKLIELAQKSYSQQAQVAVS